jgi:DNA-nicking Smr family endonuclease
MKQINERLDARIKELQETEEHMREQMAVLSEEYETYIRRQEDIITEATRRLQEIQQGDFAFQSGEILLATIIDGGMSQDQARSELLTFLRQVDRLALERGASIDGRSSAVKVQSEEHFNQVVEALALPVREIRGAGCVHQQYT